MRFKLMGVMVLLTILLGVTVAQGQELFAPFAVNGSIDNGTPFIEYPFTVLTDNSDLIVDIAKTSGDLDTLLYLVDNTGTIIGDNDDFGDTTNSRIEFPRVPAGQYTVVATRYKSIAGDSTGEFEMNVNLRRAEFGVPEYRLSPEDLAAAGYPAIEPRERADWTVLAYYGGDNNLEEGVIDDFNEF